ncbi:hypothetical protein [Chengkuizengella axinellae]|uniref:Spore coat protein n=1 Tax=Chengkuizengella axinellae TaxID=3064388 RepID=A0ABT9IXQ1_9BACL|nr:hypothetical protein [Chengkuizengella sp. 2205SS18-9]MDP5274018.1 hypothetical protein [Chengkuizengella sp. 2205SS18-9]
MGFFDDSICECCVCPMQCVLDQLKDETVSIITTTDEIENSEIIEVKNFILTIFNNDEQENEYLPVCNVSAVTFSSSKQVNLKPSRKSKKGECSCCEDPTNDFLNSRSKTELLRIRYLNGVNTGSIADLGEGIVILQDPSEPLLHAISICNINNISPGSPD